MADVGTQKRMCGNCGAMVYAEMDEACPLCCQYTKYADEVHKRYICYIPDINNVGLFEPSVTEELVAGYADQHPEFIFMLWEIEKQYRYVFYYTRGNGTINPILVRDEDEAVYYAENYTNGPVMMEEF